MHPSIHPSIHPSTRLSVRSFVIVSFFFYPFTLFFTPASTFKFNQFLLYSFLSSYF